MSIVQQKRPIMQQIVWQSILNFNFFLGGGVLHVHNVDGVLIGILVFLSDGINISS